MKITRLKKGYVIRLSDTEMSVLQTTVSEGMGSSMWDDGVASHLDPAQKRIVTEALYGKRDWMTVTEDRRFKNGR